MTKQTRRELGYAERQTIFDAFVKIAQDRPGELLSDIARDVKRAYLHIVHDVEEAEPVGKVRVYLEAGEVEFSSDASFTAR